MGALPTIVVECRNAACSRDGVRSRLQLRPIGLGFVELPHLILCTACGFAAYLVESWRPTAAQEGDDMAKITVHGGPSNAAADPPGAAGAGDSSTPSAGPGPADDTNPAPAPEPAAEPAPEPGDDVTPAMSAPAFDPSAHTVPVVVQHLEAAAAAGAQAEVERVLAAEQAGKQRTGILSFTGG